MITVKRTFTRPDLNTVWHWKALDLSAMKAYVKTTYVDTKKILKDDLAVNGLVATFTTQFADQAALSAYLADTVLQGYWTQRNVYNASVGITAGAKEVS